MQKPNFSDIYKWATIAALTLISTYAAKDIELLGIQTKYLAVLYLFISFVLAIAIVQGVWAILPRIARIISTPNNKNLHIFSGSLYGNILTLRFKNTEWRYPFKKINAFATIPSMARLTILENLEWRSTKKTEPIFIKRFKSYEINFIEVDSKNNRFSIIANSDKKAFFGVGEYGFDISSYTNIFGNFKVKNNMLVNSIGWKTSFNEQYFIVDYKGKNRISARVVDKEAAQKVMWFSKYKTPENGGSK